jgi:hypothetical protein
MCKTNIRIDLIMLTYANMNMKKIWQGYDAMLKTNVEYTKGNEESYSYLYPFEDLTQGSFQGSFYVCIK